MQKFYLQLIAWVVGVGVVFMFLWKQGYLNRLASYFGETGEELKKCSWPSKEELQQSTVLIFVVIAALFFFTFAADFLISRLVRMLMA